MCINIISRQRKERWGQNINKTKKSFYVDKKYNPQWIFSSHVFLHLYNLSLKFVKWKLPEIHGKLTEHNNNKILF